MQPVLQPHLVVRCVEQWGPQLLLQFGGQPAQQSLERAHVLGSQDAGGGEQERLVACSYRSYRTVS